MATVVDFSSVKSKVRSILHASRTAFATTVDGSKRDFRSDTEIDEAILEADGEICSLICDIDGHPYINQFKQTSTAIDTTNGGGDLPARMGQVLGVLALNAMRNASAAFSAVETTSDVIAITGQDDNFYTGLRVQISTTGTLPSPLATTTDYFLIKTATANEWQLAATYYDAVNGTNIDLTTQGTGTHTIEVQYEPGTRADTKDTVLEAAANSRVFASIPSQLTGFYYIEGSRIYSTSPSVKVIYADYNSTASPQAPERYTWGVVGGAVARLLKDGGDEQIAAYYASLHDMQKQEIIAKATVLPPIDSYHQ